MFETGWFSTLWSRMAKRLGIEAEIIPGDWRSGVDADGDRGAARGGPGRTRSRRSRVVHNETSTGVASSIAAVRRAIDGAGHPALLLVDTISSLASIDYRHDEWGVDVTVGGSQKGLMLPPGLSFNAISRQGARGREDARSLPRSFWDWEEMLAINEKGFFPYTPSTNLLQGLKVAIDMLHEEGLDNVFARHDRAAEATRRCVRHWGLEIQCRNPAEYSSSLTAVRLPDGPFGRRPAGRDPRALQHVARQRPRAARRPGLPHRPSRRLPRPHGHGRAHRASRWGCAPAASRTGRAASTRPWPTCPAMPARSRRPPSRRGQPLTTSTPPRRSSAAALEEAGRARPEAARGRRCSTRAAASRPSPRRTGPRCPRQGRPRKGLRRARARARLARPLQARGGAALLRLGRQRRRWAAPWCRCRAACSCATATARLLGAVGISGDTSDNDEAARDRRHPRCRVRGGRRVTRPAATSNPGAA